MRRAAKILWVIAGNANRFPSGIQKFVSNREARAVLYVTPDPGIKSDAWGCRGIRREGWMGSMQRSKRPAGPVSSRQGRQIRSHKAGRWFLSLVLGAAMSLDWWREWDADSQAGEGQRVITRPEHKGTRG